MNIGIDNSFYLNSFFEGTTDSSDNGEFRSMLDSILANNVLISPKIEKQLIGNSDLAQEIEQKIHELGGSLQNSIVIVNRRGEVSQYTFPKEREETHPTAEELKAVARARARKKARLDAYFHLLERVSIKRKLIEQENAKRFLSKKYRFTSTRLDSTARARQITVPPMNPDYYF